MVIQRNPLDVHIQAVRAVETAGIPAPPEWTRLQERIATFLKMSTPCRDALIAALVAGDSAEEIARLRAVAYAEVAVQPAVNNAVLAAGYEQLMALYRPQALTNYQTLADMFDAAAVEFTTAAGLVDPDAGAETIIIASEDERTAWAELPRYAARIDGLIGSLRAAAELAGTPTKKPEAQLALTVDATGVHRRRMWEAWHATAGRAGRWGSIVKAGAKIRASNLDGFTAYRLPMPLQEQFETPNGLLGPVLTTISDPEDAPETQAPARSKTDKPARMRHTG